MSGLLRLERTGAAGRVARVTLARPEVRNAFNAELIDELHRTFEALSAEPADALRAVVLAGDGEAFCAGADVEWQRRAMGLGFEENKADAGRLQAMLRAIDESPAPVVARVHGAALGGGMGLCAVADVVLATSATRFGFTETKLGILPAIISPFVLARIGEGHARALFLTGERIDAERALRVGLVHELAADDAALDGSVERVLGELLSAGPNAVREAKALIRARRSNRPDDFASQALEVAARQRVSPEGQEGLGAFLEKRAPSWRG
ncbi:MAG TPA: enoyl-CoA hydratase-related protein [Candidatus Limnocylindria bacterium]|nr:enoyl-CoA hydratase-related protein [Candidatus Limnocylindria bacterium]